MGEVARLQGMNYDVFKKDLEAYRGLIRELNDYESRHSILVYELEGVKGVRFDKVTGTPNELEIERRKLDLVELINQVETSIKYTKERIGRIEMNIGKLSEDCQTICLMNRRGISFEKIGRKMGYTKTGIQKKLKAEVEKMREQVQNVE